MLSRKFNAHVDVSLPKVAEIPGGSLDYEQSKQDTSTRDLDFEIVEFLPKLHEQTAQLLLQAPFPQINVAGRYSVDIDFEYEEPDRQQFVDFQFKEGELSNTTIRAMQYVPDSFRRPNFSDPAHGLHASDLEGWQTPDVLVSLDYVRRNVSDVTLGMQKGGATTAYEDDDVAEYVSGKVEDPPLIRQLVSKNDLRATLLLAQHRDQPVYFYSPTRHQERKNAICLMFESGTKAQDFMAWLRKNPKERVSQSVQGLLRWELLVKDAKKGFSRLDGNKLDPGAFQFILYTLNDAADVQELKECP